MPTWRIISTHSDRPAEIEGATAAREGGEFVVRDAAGGAVFRLPLSDLVSEEAIANGRPASPRAASAAPVVHDLDERAVRHAAAEDEYFFDPGAHDHDEEEYDFADDAIFGGAPLPSARAQPPRPAAPAPQPAPKPPKAAPPPPAPPRPVAPAPKAPEPAPEPIAAKPAQAKPAASPPRPEPAPVRPAPEPVRPRPAPTPEPIRPAAPPPPPPPEHPKAWRPTQIDSIEELEKALEMLTANVYKRYNGAPSEEEADRLDGDIGAIGHYVSHYLEAIPDTVAYAYRIAFDRVQEEIRNYKQVRRRKSAPKPKREISAGALEAKMDHLQRLEPLEFAKYVGSVFEARGWTPKTVEDPNGRDRRVVLSRQADLALLHAKTYGTGILISKTDVEELIRLMRRLGCRRGVFVTLNAFTFQAEKLAQEGDIELVDRVRLKDMIRQALES